MYWGKYVQHDNNRDGMGQYLKITKNFTQDVLEWHPTILHDLHEAQSYLYVSTGTGPYNISLDPIAIDEWWLLAETEVMEMAKRGVPGVFTYGFYDGWVPNYLFWIAITHNSFGRFYEVQSYGPDVNPNLTLPATATSREWYRPNPPLPSIAWGPRNNTNIQESALLIAMNKVAKDHELYLENYWLKNKRAIDKGKNGPNFAWVDPRRAAPQGRCRRHGQRTPPPGRRSPQGRLPPSKPATSMWPPATTSSAPTNPTAPSSTCTSACRTIPPPIRAPTTIPAGPCSTCATSSSKGRR